MKRILYILIASLLFLGTIGPSLNIHICRGQIVSFSFYNKPDKCCGKSCKSCKDISALYKISEKFVKKDIASNPPFFLTFELLYKEIFLLSNYQTSDITWIFIKPPPLHKYDKYILIRVLRI